MLKMINVDQGVYRYVIPEEARESIMDFIGDAILLTIRYYFEDMQQDRDESEYGDKVFEDINSLWDLYNEFRQGIFCLDSFSKIDLLCSTIELNIFEQIKELNDVDNPAYFYQIMRVWDELNEIHRQYWEIKRSQSRRSGNGYSTSK